MGSDTPLIVHVRRAVSTGAPPARRADIALALRLGFAASVATGCSLPFARAVNAAVPLGAARRILKAVLITDAAASSQRIRAAVRTPLRRAGRMGAFMGLR